MFSQRLFFVFFFLYKCLHICIVKQKKWSVKELTEQKFEYVLGILICE